MFARAHNGTGNEPFVTFLVALVSGVGGRYYWHGIYAIFLENTPIPEHYSKCIPHICNHFTRIFRNIWTISYLFIFLTFILFIYVLSIVLCISHTLLSKRPQSNYNQVISVINSWVISFGWLSMKHFECINIVCLWLDIFTKCRIHKGPGARLLGWMWLEA